jgi:hypothetical protein
MLLNADWYIEQMRRQKNDSPPVPFSLPRSKYLDGTNNLIYIMERLITTLTCVRLSILLPTTPMQAR